MNLELFQSIAREVSGKYAAAHDIVRDRHWYALKIAEEAGEVSRAFLTLLGQSRKNMPVQEAAANLGDELSDLIAHSLLLADSEGIDLISAISRKWLVFLNPGKAEP